mgnify:CR=1 FL=1
MIDKKKQHFISLSFIFGVIILFTLMNEWSKPQPLEASSSMMNDSMGNMMASMHLSNININDLVYQEESQEAATGMSSHHSAEDSELKRIHYFTTLSIIILLPFIIAGTAFLSIVWLK